MYAAQVSAQGLVAYKAFTYVSSHASSLIMAFLTRAHYILSQTEKE